MESTVSSDEGQLTLRKAHERFVFGSRTLPLVRIHWHLLHGVARVDRDSDGNDELPRNDDGSIRLPTSPPDCLGEVGRDEINWWVFRCETDHAELRRRCEQVLPHAVTLKRQSLTLSGRFKECNRYIDILKLIAGFLDSFDAEFGQLADFVEWLHQRDERAPAIMFTYRVWGSTRLHDRTSRLKASSFAEEATETTSLLAELAIGLSRHGRPQYDAIRMDMDCERSESWDEDCPYVPTAECDVVPQLAHQVLGDFAEYLEHLRQSIANVILEISKYEKTLAILESREFWGRFIHTAIQLKVQETEYWDFKQTLDMWGAKGERRKKSCVKIAEQVAAFANASGGVIIVGVANDRSIMGLEMPETLENRLKDLREVLDRHLQYPRPFFKVLEIPVVVSSQTPVSCLAIVVAQTSDVVAVRRGEQNTYPMRVATGLQRNSRERVLSQKALIRSDNYDYVLTHFTRLVVEADRNS